MTSQVKGISNKKYKIIYADPPWKWNNFNGGISSRDPENHYSTMELEEICNLNLNEISDDNSVLLIWARFPNLPDVFKVIESWGFTYKTVGFVWIKTNKDDSIFFGTGYYTRANAELLIIATKGKVLPRLTKSVSQIIMAKREEHSRKPLIFKRKIIELFGDLPRIELFAREQTHGFDVYGDEIDNSFGENPDGFCGDCLTDKGIETQLTKENAYSDWTCKKCSIELGLIDN